MMLRRHCLAWLGLAPLAALTTPQAWAADEKAAAAAAIQHWIPLIVAIEPKELRKKLKLAALESGA